MKIKGLLFFLAIISSLQGVSILKTDVGIVIGEGNILNIFAEENAKAQINFSLVFSKEGGNYKVEIPKDLDPFALSGEKITCSLADNLDFDKESSSFVFSVTDEDTSKPLSLNITFPKGVILSPGKYSSKIPISIYKNNKKESKVNLEPFFNVEEQLEAKVIIDGQEFIDNGVIDFGEILKQTSKNLALSIRSNKKVDLCACSVNNGNLLLKEDGDSSLSSCLIPYVLEKEGKSIKLTSSSDIISKDIAPNITFGITNLTIKLSPEEGKNFAGNYEDRLIFSIGSD
jgi:hypothetical protein